MTRLVVQQVRQLVHGRVQVRGATASTGCEVIATRASYALGAQAALATLRAHASWADAVLLACFGDPGLAALRAETRVPVVGMAEAALREAHALARPYRIVTAGSEWVAMLEEIAVLTGTRQWLDRVVALDTTGLAVSRDPVGFTRVVQQALDAAQADGIATVVLGGAGFAGLRAQLAFAGQLIDGLEAAVRMLDH
jgi:Asp/Glu/hydantoin racemase